VREVLLDGENDAHQRFLECSGIVYKVLHDGSIFHPRRDKIKAKLTIILILSLMNTTERQDIGM
jgi:hypothetical protein